MFTASLEQWCCGKKFKGGCSKFEIESVIIEYIVYTILYYKELFVTVV